jgi:hypothetical protein
MSVYAEIAYAVHQKRLCLITGTGFSKAVTENNAPGWQELLEQVCGLISNGDELIKSLFPTDKNHPFALDEAAQIIAIELRNNKLSMHEEVSEIIKNVKLSGDNSIIKEFLSSYSLSIATTNYDKLLEELAGIHNCHSLANGLTIPKSDTQVQVYHIHGSIDSPHNMVITSEDYFRFMRKENYYSRKLSTFLHENTVVILGYSLGDVDLKSIINEYREFASGQMVGANIFFVSRSPVDQHIKDYYSNIYGIRVLDNLLIPDFIGALEAEIEQSKDRLDASLSNIKLVLDEGHLYKDEFIRIENSFYEIISSCAALGRSISEQKVVELIGVILEQKRILTNSQNAWEQYEHLARWLTYLGSILEINGTSIEKVYLKATKRSMITMRKELYIGYSWHAYKAWKSQWLNIIPGNRNLITEYINKQTTWADALDVVNEL